jgi:Glycosyltransferases, probably involved in cell wall biogenesis
LTNKYDKIVSIIVPVFNVDQFVFDALMSIENQTYNCNIELIVINDGSTDNSLKIVEDFFSISKLSLKYLYSFSENRGPSFARNFGIEHSKGKYIYFLDSDDILKNTTIEECVSMIEKTDVDLITFNSVFFNDISEIETNKKVGFKNLKGNNVYGMREFLERVNKQRLTAVWMYFYKREFIKSLDELFYEGIFYEDALFTERCHISFDKILFYNEILVYHRINVNSITQEVDNSDFRAFSYTKVLEQTKKLIEKTDDGCVKKYLSYQQGMTLNELIKFKRLSIRDLIKMKDKFKARWSVKDFIKAMRIEIQRIKG